MEDNIGRYITRLVVIRLVLLSLADTPFEIINDNASSLRKRDECVG